MERGTTTSLSVMVRMARGLWSSHWKLKPQFLALRLISVSGVCVWVTENTGSGAWHTDKMPQTPHSTKEQGLAYCMMKGLHGGCCVTPFLCQPRGGGGVLFGASRQSYSTKRVISKTSRKGQYKICPSGIWTRDLEITTQRLYSLSYPVSPFSI